MRSLRLLNKIPVSSTLKKKSARVACPWLCDHCFDGGARIPVNSELAIACPFPSPNQLIERVSHVFLKKRGEGGVGEMSPLSPVAPGGKSQIHL